MRYNCGCSHAKGHQESVVQRVVNFILRVSDSCCLTQVFVWKLRGENFREASDIEGETL